MYEQHKYDFSEAIERGVKLLNRFAPDWFNHVNLDRLELASGRYCVLGQLAMADFHERLTEYFRHEARPHRYDYADLIDWLRDHGFVYGQPDAGVFYGFSLRGSENQPWEALTLQWVERIEKLRAEAGTLA